MLGMESNQEEFVFNGTTVYNGTLTPGNKTADDSFNTVQLSMKQNEEKFKPSPKDEKSKGAKKDQR